MNNDANSTQEPVNIVSVCSGYGGLDEGFRSALPNSRVIVNLEIEAFSCHNMVQAMEAGEMAPAPVWTDLRSFPFEELRGIPNLAIVGGIPCQPFSAAGLREGDADPRDLAEVFIRGAEACAAEFVLIENVSGLVSSKLKFARWGDPAGYPILLGILKRLEKAGYRTTWGLNTAAEIGAPHKRERVFILGTRLGKHRLGEFVYDRLESDSDGYPFPSGPGGQFGWEAPRTVSKSDIAMAHDYRGRQQGLTERNGEPLEA